MFPIESSCPMELTDTDFEKISRLVYDQCGINLSDGKRELVRARLGKRIRKGQFQSFRDYYRHVVEDGSGEELIYLLDSISTNFTFFFREPKHFDYLRLELLPEWKEKGGNRARSLRIWSAGCSSGEEPYSIVITLLEALGNPPPGEISVLATDLSTKVLKAAEAGVFHKDRIHSIPAQQARKYFLKGDNQWRDHVKVKDPVRACTRFRRLNLMEPFRLESPFDCIFCRNVMIYFDRKTQTNLVARFYEALKPGGVLFIGHSESLTGIPHPFTYVKPAIYKKG
jgi:chemotaxis protein methyltransferase CheR